MHLPPTPKYKQSRDYEQAPRLSIYWDLTNKDGLDSYNGSTLLLQYVTI